MDEEKRSQAEESIMDAECDLCHWPYVYHSSEEETMWSEKCDYCPAAAAVKAALKGASE